MKRFAVAMALSACSMFGIAALAEHDAKSCSSNCKECAEVCEKTLDYCTKKGGAHAKAEHINVMKDCITVCKANADLRSRNSKYVDAMSKICSELCTDCAASCEKLKDPKMKNCIDECKKCADCCKNQ